MRTALILLMAAGILAVGCRTRGERLEDELVESARSGYIYTVMALLEAGVDVNARAGPNLNTALLSAASAGHLKVVDYLLENGAEVDARSGIRYATPLMGAVENGHLPVVKRLLAAGADMDLRGYPVEITHAGRIIYKGKTAFLLAVAAGNIEIARELRDAGADVMLEDENGRPPIDVALRAGQEDMARELVRWWRE